MSEPSGTEPDVSAPGRSPRPRPRRALVVVGVVAWAAIAGVALHFRQQGLDDEKGLPRRAWFASRPMPPPPPPAPPPPRASGPAACMTSRQYQRLQQLPPYGVVKSGSALEASIRAAAAARIRDGGH